MESETTCQSCGEEYDGDFVWCHECDRRICDDCIALTNHEHGLYFCVGCTDKHPEWNETAEDE